MYFELALPVSVIQIFIFSVFFISHGVNIIIILYIFPNVYVLNKNVFSLYMRLASESISMHVAYLYFSSPSAMIHRLYNSVGQPVLYDQ